jgi:hypothetical protein
MGFLFLSFVIPPRGQMGEQRGRHSNLSKTWLRRLPGAATRAAPGPLDRLQGQGDLEMDFRFKDDGRAIRGSDEIRTEEL